MKAKLSSQVAQSRLVLADAIPLATPLVVYIEPSGYCNLKCVFCPCGIEESSLKKDIMPIALFKKLMDDLREFPDKVKLLRFCGNGDPLINKGILEMLRYARERNISARIELITNGLLLTEELIDGLSRYLDRLVCSVEGLSSEDYRQMCGTDMNFQSFLDKLSLLYDKRRDCVIHIKIHHEAVSQDERKNTFLKLFSSYCDEIFIEKLVPMWPQLYSSHFTKEFRWEDNKTITKHQVCAQIFKGLQVQADGKVVPCCVDWKRVNVLGDINRDSISAKFGLEIHSEYCKWHIWVEARANWNHAKIVL